MMESYAVGIERRELAVGSQSGMTILTFPRCECHTKPEFEQKLAKIAKKNLLSGKPPAARVDRGTRTACRA